MTARIVRLGCRSTRLCLAAASGACQAPRELERLSVARYLWAAAMDGHATVGGTRSGVDVPFKDTL